MSAHLLQPSLTAGEVAPALYGRVDTARYAVGLKRCRNFIVRPYGGVENRAGLRYLGAANKTDALRLLPFVFSTEVAYVLEFTGNVMRFWAGDALVKVLASDTAAWSSTINYARGAYVNVAGVVYRCLAACKNRAPASYPTYWTSDASLLIYTPWSATEMWEVRYTQSADIMYLVHPSYPPQCLSRVSSTFFTLKAYVNLEGPFQDLNTNTALSLVCSGVTGNITVSASGPLFNQTAVGAMLYIESKNLGLVKPWVVGDRSIAIGQLRRSDGKTYKCTALPSYGGLSWQETGNRQPIHDSGRAWDGAGDKKDNGSQTWSVGAEWEYQDSGYGIVQIVAVLDSMTATATVQKRLPAQVVGTPPSTTHTWTPVANGGTVYPIAGADDGLFGVTLDGVPLAPDPYYSPPPDTGPGTGGGGGGTRVP